MRLEAYAELEGVARVDALRFDASQGMGSEALYFEPTTGAKSTTLIFHLGHWAAFDLVPEVPIHFVRAGHPVLLLSMIMQGPNYEAHRSLVLPDGETQIQLEGSHWDLRTAEAQGVHTIRLFFEPLARAMNFVEARSDAVVLAGLSGGGWTVDVYAPMDPRVDGVVSVAGSIPHGLRARPDIGDYEQLAGRPLYAIADFPRLYLASARWRPHHQVFHENDACCFAWAGRQAAFQAYADEINARLQAEGRPPNFGLTLIPEVEAHVVHPEGIQVIEQVMAAVSSTEG